MKYALPDTTGCPKCGGTFTSRREPHKAMQPNAHDELEWLWAKCGRSGIEQRKRADGTADDWPPSEFER